MSYKEEGLRCRNCFHNNHYDFDENTIKDKCGHNGGYYSDYETCPCEQFEAYSNLDYLEYCYEKASK